MVARIRGNWRSIILISQNLPSPLRATRLRGTRGLAKQVAPRARSNCQCILFWNLMPLDEACVSAAEQAAGEHKQDTKPQMCLRLRGGGCRGCGREAPEQEGLLYAERLLQCERASAPRGSRLCPRPFSFVLLSQRSSVVYVVSFTGKI